MWLTPSHQINSIRATSHAPDQLEKNLMFLVKINKAKIYHSPKVQFDYTTIEFFYSIAVT